MSAPRANTWSGCLAVAMLWLSAIMATAATGPQVDGALLAAAQRALPEGIDSNELARAVETGLWDSDRSGLAVSLAKPKGSIVLVFLRRTGGRYLAVDVSRVEGSNFGKLGDAGRAGYERFETTPVRWLGRDDGRFQVELRTRAWKGGKRFTVSEPLVINPDGTPQWR